MSGKQRVTIRTFLGTITTIPLDPALAEQIAAEARRIGAPGITGVTVTPAE